MITIVAAVIGAVVVLLAGMAGLIKSMVISRLGEIQAAVSGLSLDMHRMDVRLTKLETEHAIHTCKRFEVNE